jgi:Tfp pilus assembly protein PilF
MTVAMAVGFFASCESGDTSSDISLARSDNAQSQQRFDQGMAYFNQDELGKAIGEFTAALDIDSKFSKAYFMRGTAHSKRGQFEVVIINFDQAAALVPGTPSFISSEARPMRTI